MKTTSPRHRLPPRRGAFVLAVALAFAGVHASALAQDAVPAAPLTSGDATLQPGDYEWTPDVAASGPVTVIVSLPAQEVHVYRGDARIGRASISSGRPGYDTPAGVYEILEKDRDHRSNKYDDAPMPYMQRLTWDGIALHSGRNPGYPASHGCIRLPDAFAAQLFEVTEKGGRVIVADAGTASEAVLYPGARSPVDPWTGQERTAGTATGFATAGATSVARGAPALAGK